MKTILIDANSHIRVRLENGERKLMRGLLNEALQTNVMRIWVWDGRDALASRRAIFPNYKNRPSSPRSTYLHLKLVREMLALTPAWQARLAGFEADDLIAGFVQRLAGPKEILTSDVDLTALGVPCIGTKSKIPSELVRLYKLCVGDPSDRIPGIGGFGKETWERTDKAALQRLIDAALTGREWDEALLPKRCTNWLKENAPVLLAMKEVLDPLPITDTQLSSSLRQGVNNPAAREAIMSQYLL